MALHAKAVLKTFQTVFVYSESILIEQYRLKPPAIVAAAAAGVGLLMAAINGVLQPAAGGGCIAWHALAVVMQAGEIISGQLCRPALRRLRAQCAAWAESAAMPGRCQCIHAQIGLGFARGRGRAASR